MFRRQEPMRLYVVVHRCPASAGKRSLLFANTVCSQSLDLAQDFRGVVTLVAELMVISPGKNVAEHILRWIRQVLLVVIVFGEFCSTAWTVGNVDRFQPVHNRDFSACP